MHEIRVNKIAGEKSLSNRLTNSASEQIKTAGKTQFGLPIHSHTGSQTKIKQTCFEKKWDTAKCAGKNRASRSTNQKNRCGINAKTFNCYSIIRYLFSQIYKIPFALRNV